MVCDSELYHEVGRLIWFAAKNYQSISNITYIAM